jgi:hypothetical protein
MLEYFYKLFYKQRVGFAAPAPVSPLLISILFMKKPKKKRKKHPLQVYVSQE